MKTKFMLLIPIFITTSLAIFGQTNRQPVDYVNMFTGTSNSRWMLGPYAGVPYGMVQGIRSVGSGKELSGMERLNIYNKIGYVLYEIDASCRTLDYSFTDYCAAQMAKAMNKNTDYTFFEKRSNNCKKQFNPELKMQVPKDYMGKWINNYDPFSGEHWIEGNGWQYTWYVPYDVKGLVTLMGKDLFNSRLEEGFEKSVKSNFAAYAFDRHQEIAYENYINHGNEGNMQASFLFNYSGKTMAYSKIYTFHSR